MDQTIREGEDTPDVLYTKAAKFKILDKLEEIGVTETEVGYAGAINEQYEFAKSIKKRGYKLTLGRITGATPGVTNGGTGYEQEH